MSRGAPRRASGPKRPSRPTSGGVRKPPPLERSYAQKVRADRQASGPSYHSKARRAQFWAAVQAQQAADQQQALDYVSSNPPVSEVQLASANVHQATLESPTPAVPGTGISIPGMDQSGFVPPPVTGA